MYAIIQTGGKQYKVSTGDLITVEKLNDEVGKMINFSNILMLHDGTTLTVGAPLLEGASVKAEIVEHYKADKVMIFKKRRRHNYRRKRGHRQQVTDISIKSIEAAVV